MTRMIHTWINGRWALELPEHRHLRPEWPWWEAHRLAALNYVISTHPAAAPCVWDIGAEEGDFPALYSSWGADVVLFEPNARVWPNIRAIWEINDLRPPLGSFVGFATDRADNGNDGAHSGGWPSCAYGEVIGDHGFCNVWERPDIPKTTIDQKVADGWRPPVVITMDVEGAEHLVLAGATNTLRNHRPEVFVSIHPEFARDMYGIPNQAEAIGAFMTAEGYIPRFLCTDHEEHWWFSPNESAYARR